MQKYVPLELQSYFTVKFLNQCNIYINISYAKLFKIIFHTSILMIDVFKEVPSPELLAVREDP